MLSVEPIEFNLLLADLKVNIETDAWCPGNILDLTHHRTWEFRSSAPVRSIFPLWPVYALPLLVLRSLWTGFGRGDLPSAVIYYSLRISMFILSVVFEDWAIHELVQSHRHRKLAVILVASSYVTWTYQTHTFSNAIETLVVLWSLVLMQRMFDKQVRCIIIRVELELITNSSGHHSFHQVSLVLFLHLASLIV